MFHRADTFMRAPVDHGYQILGFQILATRFGLAELLYQIGATRSGIPDPGYQILASRSWLPNPGLLSWHSSPRIACFIAFLECSPFAIDGSGPPTLTRFPRVLAEYSPSTHRVLTRCLPGNHRIGNVSDAPKPADIQTIFHPHISHSILYNTYDSK